MVWRSYVETFQKNVEVLDPAGALISLRYTKNMGSVLSNPDWFGDAMVKLSSPTVSIVQKQFPLPPKVQQSLIQYDFEVVANRISALSVSKSQQSKPSPRCSIRYKVSQVPQVDICKVVDCWVPRNI